MKGVEFVLRSRARAAARTSAGICTVTLLANPRLVKTVLDGDGDVDDEHDDVREGTVDDGGDVDGDEDDDVREDKVDNDNDRGAFSVGNDHN